MMNFRKWFACLALVVGLTLVPTLAVAPPLNKLYTFDEAGWTTQNYCGQAEIGPNYGVVSQSVALSVAGNNTCINGGIGYIPISLEYDKTYEVSAFVNGDLADEGTPLRVFVTAGFMFPFMGTVHKSDVGPGFHKVILFTIRINSPVPPDEEINPHLLFIGAGLMNGASLPDGSQGGTGEAATGRWTIDDLRVREVKSLVIQAE